jgi:hypothetical protein
MRIGIFGDIHARFKAPRSRVDNWFDVQYGKFMQALTIFKEEGCELILQPGDFFDSPKPVYQVVSTYLRALEQSGLLCLTVLGQHDVYYHDVADPRRTPTDVLAAATVAYILLPGKPVRSGNVQVYGASWGQEAESVKRKGDNVYILVAHAHVGNRPLFAGHDLPSPVDYATKHSGYDLIVLGDYHYTFTATVGSTKVINCGCLMRMRNTPDERKHQPSVAVYDTETRQLELHPLSIQDADKVFVDRVVEDHKPSEELEAFLTHLKKSGEIGTSFLDNLNSLMDKENASDELRSVVSRILETVGIKDEA